MHSLASKASSLSCLIFCLLGVPTIAQSQVWEATQLGDSPIELRAYWEPLTDAVYNFDKNPLIRELKVAEEKKTWKSSDFQPFLPTNDAKLGDLWEVDPRKVLPILKQFHVGARSQLHHGSVASPGGWACLSSVGDNFAEVHFRIHAEFLLEGDGGTMKSSWFTPAQFQGRMTVDNIAKKVVAFQIGVPLQSANVDINLPIGADIGRIPRMELLGGKFPEPVNDGRRIAKEQIEKLLATKFYRFAEIDWYDLAEARALSIKTGKPLHVIALFGSLDDESC